MARAAEADKLKATRGAAARRAVDSIDEMLRKALPALAERGVAAAAEQRDTLEQLLARLTPLLPVDAPDSDDDEYF